MATKSAPGQKYTEESFGHHIPQVGVSKGSIAIFGDTVRDAKIGSTKTTSVNQKTGYPGNEKV